MIHRFCLIALMVLSAGFFSSGKALEGGDILARPEPWAEVMVLGTFHMGSETNVFESEKADILGEVRQRELDQLADILSVWQPTMIAVEIEPAFQQEYRSAYGQWQDGGEPRGWKDEYAQIAFRLVDRVAGLESDDLYAIDRQDWNWPSEEEEALDIEADQRLRAIERSYAAYGETMGKADQASLDERSLAGHLAYLNSDERMQQARDYEMRFSMLKWQEDNPGGAHTVAVFQERNLLIFQNLLKALEERRGSWQEETTAERVLVVYGSGHASALNELVEASPYTSKMSAGSYLFQALSGDTAK